MDKSPDAFRTISEVAGDLDLPQHVLRFWETRFNQIRPLKRGGGRRYYRPDDVDLLKGVRHLLYGEGYTIRGVQRILKEEGVRFVMDVWREGAPQPPRGGRQSDDEDVPQAAAPHAAAQPSAGWDAEEEADVAFLHAGLERADAEAEAVPSTDGDEGAPLRIEPTMDPEVRAAHVLAQRFAPRGPAPSVEPAAPVFAPSSQTGGVSAAFVEPGRVGFGQLLDRLRPPTPPSAATAVVAPPPAAVATISGEGSAGLSRDDIRRLQATLFELLECKRLLDQMR